MDPCGDWTPPAGLRLTTVTLDAGPAGAGSTGSGSSWARRYEPARIRRPVAGWVLLHGVTRAGPDHPAIVRLALSLARARGIVLVPNVPEWRRLDLDPAPAQRTLTSAVAHLNADPRARRGTVLAGLSFGCPQVLRLGAQLGRLGLVGAVVCFGGYASLHHTIRFGLTGHYGTPGRTRYLRPDPYGRWVVAANYLHRIPGYGDAEDVSAALRTLALLAAERGIMSWDARYDDAKNRLESELSSPQRRLFRLFAPPADREPDPAAARAIASRLARAATATHPDLRIIEEADSEEIPARARWALGPLPPVRLFHGRMDHLVPYTETARLERALGPHADVRATVSTLFSHSGEGERGPGRLMEGLRFLLAIRDLMALPYRVDRVRRPGLSKPHLDAPGD